MTTATPALPECLRKVETEPSVERCGSPPRRRSNRRPSHGSGRDGMSKARLSGVAEAIAQAAQTVSSTMKSNPTCAKTR